MTKWPIRSTNLIVLDRPLTDLHETEGDGGFPGAHFMARPVIGGHFAYLTLQRACGGKALDGLTFLNKASNHHAEPALLPQVEEEL